VVKALAHHSDIALTENAPDPVLQPDHVLVDVYSAGLNFFDTLQTQGKYQFKPPLPFVLGHEFAGRISPSSPIPRDCTFKPGDRVFGGQQGAFAEKIAVSWKRLVPLPDALSFDEGASLFLTWPTSYEALVGRAELKPGEWVFVTASAGGVGLAAVQLAKALGAKVIGAAGSEHKRQLVKHIGGADHSVDYTKPGWQKDVMTLTGGRGVDVIFDPVGMIRDCLKCIAWKGRAIVIGFAGGQIENLALNVVLMKNISILGLHWGAYFEQEPPRVAEVFKEIMDLIASGRVKPIIYEEIFPLDKVGQGLDAISARRTWGKPVLRIKEEQHSTVAKL
jgi:NADPH2:quinone reductase